MDDDVMDEDDVFPPILEDLQWKPEIFLLVCMILCLLYVFWQRGF